MSSMKTFCCTARLTDPGREPTDGRACHIDMEVALGQDKGSRAVPWN